MAWRKRLCNPTVAGDVTAGHSRHPPLIGASPRNLCFSKKGILGYVRRQLSEICKIPLTIVLPLHLRIRIVAMPAREELKAQANDRVSRERLLAIVGATILRLLFLTLRLDLEDRAGLSKNVPKSPVIICFWHNRILGITLTFLRHYPKKSRKGVTVLTSASRDGEVLAQFVGQFGMGAVRGSSSRRGSRALLELVDTVENGRDIAITPDGPRGPRYSFGPGAISLAQLTATPIVPMHARFSRYFALKSWDGFIIPLPFSKISVIVDDPIPVPRELSDEEFEALRLRVETLLREQAVSSTNRRGTDGESRSVQQELGGEAMGKAS
jgi:lysophospholipid acyltransferase (LPLAT)-like uncharacterized protein